MNAAARTCLDGTATGGKNAPTDWRSLFFRTMRHLAPQLAPQLAGQLPGNRAPGPIAHRNQSGVFEASPWTPQMPTRASASSPWTMRGYLKTVLPMPLTSSYRCRPHRHVPRHGGHRCPVAARRRWTGLAVPAFINQDVGLRDLISTLIQRLSRYVLLDPYASAFLRDPASRRAPQWAQVDRTDMKPGVAERKWEIDSLC